MATDGPFAESRESLVGFWAVDVEHEARAVEIAARISRAADARVEDLLRELAPQVLGVLVRRRREEAVAALEPLDQAAPSGQDDSLALPLMCCHPVLPAPPSSR